MRIDGTNRIDYVNKTYKNNSESINDIKGKKALCTSQDSIELSKTSKDLKKQIEKLSTTDTIDMQKVSSIKQAIQNGTYRVSPKEIASEMMQKITEQNSLGEE